MKKYLNEATLRNLIYEKVVKALDEIAIQEKSAWDDYYGDSDPNTHDCDFLGGDKWRYKGEMFDSFDDYINARAQDDYHDGAYWLDGQKMNLKNYRAWVRTKEYFKFEKEVVKKNNAETFDVKASEITPEFIKDIVGSYGKKKYIGGFPEISPDGEFSLDPEKDENYERLGLDEIEEYINKVINRYGDLDAHVTVTCPIQHKHYNDDLWYTQDYHVDFDEEGRDNANRERQARAEKGWGDFVSRQMEIDAARGWYTD